MRLFHSTCGEEAGQQPIGRMMDLLIHSGLGHLDAFVLISVSLVCALHTA